MHSASIHQLLAVNTERTLAAERIVLNAVRIKPDGVRCVENVPLKLEGLAFHDGELLGNAPIDGEVPVAAEYIPLP